MTDITLALLGDHEAAGQPMNIAYNMDCMEYMRTLPDNAFDLAIAAWDAGLDFVGCEIDGEYFDAQEKRFGQHTAQENLFLNTRAPILSAEEMERLEALHSETKTD